MILIRKFVKLCCFMAVFIVFAGCGRDSLTVTNTPDTNVFVLDEELAAKPREGVILGTPLRRDEMIKLEDVINVWGEPVQVYDHEDIQTYEYSVNGRRVLKYEDETGLPYISRLRWELPAMKSFIIWEIRPKEISREKLFSIMTSITGLRSGRRLNL